MGGSSSKPLLKGDSYSDRARTAKDLADKILTLLFSEADFKDLLSLSSISQCPRYVFTTASALQQLFQSIQVYPQLGKDGEILFAPIQRLAPGLLSKDKKEDTEADRQRRGIRDRMCMDIAYIYVRIFQIYGALALTVLDADPVRQRVRVDTFGAPRGRAAAPGRATFFGGRMPSTSPLTKSIANTPFAPLTPFFSPAKLGVSTTKQYIQMDDTTNRKAEGGFYIKWDASLGRQDTMKVEGFYKFAKTNKVSEAVVLEMKWTDARHDTAILYFDGREFVQFQRAALDMWEFLYPSGASSDPTEFITRIHEFFENYELARGAAPGVRRAATTSSTGVGLTLGSGKSSFESFDQLKKLYEDRLSGKGFPKAYCVARAMTLLKPIFDSEHFDPRLKQYTSQVCKKTLDFEPAGSDTMPRAGKQPKANIYFRSLVSLYYDNYEVRSNGEVVFSQTAEARAKLQSLSKQFAQLFNVTTKPEEFLESGTAFTESKVLCGGQDVELLIKDDKLRQQLLNESVLPLLKFQEQHTAKVNELLKKMFSVTVDKQGRASLAFSKNLKAGRAAVNQFGAMARDLLIDYYLRSEVYYTKGILILEKNPQGIQKFV